MFSLPLRTQVQTLPPGTPRDHHGGFSRREIIFWIDTMPRPSPQRNVSPRTPLPDRGKNIISVVPHLCGGASHGPSLPSCHSDPQRRFTGTCVSCELNKALDGDYKLDKVYEVCHFPQQNTDLFRRYIDTFLKIKQEASGFPPHCETQEEKRFTFKRFLDERKSC